MCECERMYVYRSVVLKSIFTNPEYNILITWYLNLYSAVALFWKMHILQTQAYDILFADLQTLTYNIILSDTRCHACKLYHYTVGCVSVRGCMCSVVLKKHIYKSTHITFYCTDLETLTNSIILQIYKPSHISNIVFANTICCACKYYNCNMCECERMVCIVLFWKKITNNV